MKNDSSIKKKESLLAMSIKNRFEELKQSLNSMTFKVPGQEISPPEFMHQRSRSSDAYLEKNEEFTSSKKRSISQTVVEDFS
jgi:hypothetical protein